MLLGKIKNLLEFVIEMQYVFCVAATGIFQVLKS